MPESGSRKKISKREFIKYGILGIGGVALGSSYVKSLAGYFKDNNDNSAGLGRDFSSDLWKWSKESPYYISMPNGVKCQLCPNQCLIKPDSKSLCRTRINHNNKLYSIAYGNPCSVNIDPVEKKPLFHFYPGTTAYSLATAGCNLACLNCQNWNISQSSPFDTTNYDLMPDKVVEKAIAGKCKSIAYTYSEPTVFYEYTFDTAKTARGKGIKNILKSSGYINEKPLRELCKYLDAANIDLKSFDNNIYMKLNAGSLEPVLRTLKILKEEKVWLEITNLIVPQWTDNMDMIKKMCDWLCKNELNNYPLHFSRFFPTYKLNQLPPTPVSALEKARDIAVNAGMKYVYVGNVPEISGENTYCPKCKKIVVERKGYKIISINIQNNSCKYCKEAIHGLW